MQRTTLTLRIFEDLDDLRNAKFPVWQTGLIDPHTLNHALLIFF
jgi:hypothetical protein